MHGVVEAVGVEVLDRLADALLEVRRRDDLQVLLRRQPLLADLTVGRLHDQLEVVDADPARHPAMTILLRPVLAVVGEDRAHRLVAPAIATDGLERRTDVLHPVLDAQAIRHQPAEPGRLGPGVLFGQQQALHALCPKGAHRERRAHGAVHATRQRGHDAASMQDARDDLHQALRDSRRLLCAVDVEHCRRQHCPLRLSLLSHRLSSGGRAGPGQLALYVTPDAVEAVEVVGNHFLRLHRDSECLLEKGDQLDERRSNR